MAKKLTVQTVEQEHPSHKKVMTRLNRISGQVEGVKKMIDEGRYCPEILMQLRAIRSALKGVESKVLESHLQSCVLNAFRSESDLDRKRKMDELIEIFERYS